MPVPIPGRIAEAVRRSTAQVLCESEIQQGHGSAVVLTGDQVITNAHVIHGSRLQVETWEGRRLAASVKKLNRRRDLCLLSVPGLDAAAATLGDSEGLKAGTPVLAVGNPLGFSGAVSSGVVHLVGPAPPLSGLPWIHADIRLAPGNSGGPLANFQGHVIGLNTMVVSGGLALAVPSRAVQTFLSQNESARSLGVTVRPIGIRRRGMGLMILELTPGGAAENASLVPGDILVAANEAQFQYVDDLQRAIEEAPQAILRLQFYRGGQKSLRQVTVRVAPEQVLSAA